MVSNGNELQVVVFQLGASTYALRLESVKRVIPSVEVSSLPSAPEIVLGVINVEGRIVPVFDVRRRFRLPKKSLALADRIILARTSRREVALIVDHVVGVMTPTVSEVVLSNEVLDRVDYVEGVIPLEDGVALIHNLDTFLGCDEVAALENALNAPVSHSA